MVRIIQNTGKIIVFVTHDPVIALLTKKRIIMQNGAVKKVIIRSDLEVTAAYNLLEYDKKVSIIRERLRTGKMITKELVSASLA